MSRTIRTPLLLCTAALAACGGALSPGQEVGETSAGITAGEAFCQIVDALPKQKIGDVEISDLACSYTDYDDNLFYLGSDFGSLLSGATDRSAEAGADSILCALHDADRSQPAQALLDAGALGKFGFDSIVEIGHFDAQARTIDGQRLGRLWLFGVPLAFDVQDFTARFPVETKVSGSRFFQTRTSGYYANFTSSRTNWRIAGDTTVDFPPPVEFKLSLDHHGQYRAYQNDALSWQQHPQDQTADGNFRQNNDLSYDTWARSCVCAGFICNCPTAADQQAHANIFDYTNLSDTRLPWTGTSHGVVGPYAYLFPQRNWWHFGYPKGGHVLNEIDESGTDVTHLSFSAGLRYDIVHINLQLDAGFSSGLALYQTDTNIDHPQIATGTELDTRVTAGVTAHLVVDSPFPFGPDPLIDADFTVLSPQSKVSSTNPSYESFSNGVGFPDATLERCMATTPAANPVTPPTDPGVGLNSVIGAAQASLTPCDIALCKPSSLTSSTGTLQTCVWDSAAKKIACSDTGRPCNVCTDSSVQLCDPAGNRLPRTNLMQHGCGTPR